MDHIGRRGSRDVPVSRRAAALRASARRLGAEHAEHLRRVAAVVDECVTAARSCARPASGSRPSDLELVHTLAADELTMVLGVSRAEAERLAGLAHQLVRVLPDTLAALEQGRIDLSRARVIADATGVLDIRTARAVEALVLPQAGEAAWSGPSPRAWRERVERAVVRADVDAARRRRERAVQARAVRAWADRNGMGVLQVTAGLADIALADRVITDLALARPAQDSAGAPSTMDQRRVDALIDLLRRVGTGAEPPRLPVRREREVGVVLHADTLFRDGPAADDPGVVLGLGAPAPLDPRGAGGSARAEIAEGASIRVLLTDGAGHLMRCVRLPGVAGRSWTREGLTAAVRAALPTLPPLVTERYEPTLAIAEHVRVLHPRCTAYDCARASRRCDLDHDQPWPRGPTSVENLAPRCRRHHEHKTSRLVTTRLHPDGSLVTTSLLGVRVSTAPQPLPGFGRGEGYAGAAYGGSL